MVPYYLWIWHVSVFAQALLFYNMSPWFLKTIKWCLLSCKHLQKLGLKAKHQNSWVAKDCGVQTGMRFGPHIPEIPRQPEVLEWAILNSAFSDDIGCSSSGTGHCSFPLYTIMWKYVYGNSCSLYLLKEGLRTLWLQWCMDG